MTANGLDVADHHGHGPFFLGNAPARSYGTQLVATRWQPELIIFLAAIQHALLAEAGEHVFSWSELDCSIASQQSSHKVDLIMTFTHVDRSLIDQSRCVAVNSQAETILATVHLQASSVGESGPICPLKDQTVASLQSVDLLLISNGPGDGLGRF